MKLLPHGPKGRGKPVDLRGGQVARLDIEGPGDPARTMVAAA